MAKRNKTPPSRDFDKPDIRAVGYPHSPTASGLWFGLHIRLAAGALGDLLLEPVGKAADPGQSGGVGIPDQVVVVVGVVALGEEAGQQAAGDQIPRQHIAAQGDPLAGEHHVDRQAVVVDLEALDPAQVEPIARFLQPLLPRDSGVVGPGDDDGVVEILDTLQPLGQGRRADRKDALPDQQAGAQLGVDPVAVADRQIHATSAYGLHLGVGVEAHFDLGVAFDEAPEPRHQPAAGEGGDDGDVQHPCQRLTLEGGHALLERRHALADPGEQACTPLGQAHVAPLADKQLDPQTLLQPPDLLADRRLGDEQLLGGAGIAAVAGRRLEGVQGADLGDV